MTTVDGVSHDGPLPQFKVKSIIADGGYVYVDYEVAGAPQPRERLTRKQALDRAEGLKNLIATRHQSLYTSDTIRMTELAEKLILAAARAAEQIGQGYESQSVKVFIESQKPGSEFYAGPIRD